MAVFSSDCALRIVHIILLNPRGADMGVLTGIFIGLASAAAFFLIQKYLLDWKYPWDLVSTIAVFAASCAFALFFQKWTFGKGDEDKRIMSGNRVQGSMKGNIEDSEIISPTPSVLSDNKIGGDAEFQINNSKI